MLFEISLRYKKFKYLTSFRTLMYLVGTIHYDIKGAERLEKLLRYLKPKSVGIEWCVESGSLAPEYDELLADVQLFEDVISRGKEKLSSLDLPENFKESLGTVLDSSGYELKVTAKLIDELDYRIYCVDYPPLREEKLKEIRVEDLLVVFTDEELETIKKLSKQEILDGWIKLCDRAYSDPLAFSVVAKALKGREINLPEEYLQKLMTVKDEREKYIADSVEQLKPDVQICGLSHTYLELPYALTEKPFISEKTLANRISHLNPQTLRLIEAEIERK